MKRKQTSNEVENQIGVSAVFSQRSYNVFTITICQYAKQ